MKNDYNFILLAGTDTSDNLSALKYINLNYPKFKKICYLPAEKDGAGVEIKQAQKDFKRYVKALRFDSLILEDATTKQAKMKIEAADVLFLGGGNTFHFYDQVQRHRLKASFKKHLSKGKLIIGLSAGSIILSPSLMMACFPSKDADECDVERRDFKGLDFFTIEICPHYRKSKEMEKDLLAYSSLHKNLICGIRDGEFLSISKSGLYLSGQTHLFFHGERIKLY